MFSAAPARPSFARQGFCPHALAGAVLCSPPVLLDTVQGARGAELLTPEGNSLFFDTGLSSSHIILM